MIEKLTPEQEATLPKKRDEWLKIGLATLPPEGESAQAIIDAVALAYKAADLEPPEVAFVGSPMAAVTLMRQVLGKPDEQPAWLWGQHSAGWLSRYDTHAQWLPEVCAPLKGLIELAKLVGWWLALDKLAIMSPKPSILERDEEGDLHCEDGPAVRYIDGFSLWFWHGVSVPEHVIMDPASITLESIQKEQNAEVKRIMRERYGDGRYLSDIGAKVIHTDSVPTDSVDGSGSITRALMEDQEGTRFLVAADGSTSRVYTMQVPSDVFTCREAAEALSGGLSEEKTLFQC